jgi:hypothetical protein
LALTPKQNLNKMAVELEPEKDLDMMMELEQRRMNRMVEIDFPPG